MAIMKVSFLVADGAVVCDKVIARVPVIYNLIISQLTEPRVLYNGRLSLSNSSYVFSRVARATQKSRDAVIDICVDRIRLCLCMLRRFTFTLIGSGFRSID